MPKAIALLVLCLVACQGPREVSVQVSIPGLDAIDAPAAGITVIALPYDRDSLLAQLAARAPTPRPGSAPLDSAFAQFRGPFAALSAATYRAEKLRDSVDVMTSRRDALPAGAEREALEARLRTAADSLGAAEARRERARTALDSARAVLRRSDSIRSAIRLWENSTYAGWDSAVRDLVFASRQEPQVDTTDAVGRARFSLGPGRWWIYARSWDTGDPNAEWYWNIPVVADTIVLSGETGQHRPRY